MFMPGGSRASWARGPAPGFSITFAEVVWGYRPAGYAAIAAIENAK